MGDSGLILLLLASISVVLGCNKTAKYQDTKNEPSKKSMGATNKDAAAPVDAALPDARQEVLESLGNLSFPEHSNCQGYVGLIVPTITTSRAIGAMPEFSVKDEFESQADYKKRLAKLAKGLPRTLIVRKTKVQLPEGEPSYDKGISYDAEKQVFEITASDFTGMTLEMSERVSAANMDEYLEVDVLDSNIAVRTDVKLMKLPGTTTAQNAMGAAVEVAATIMQIGFIFEGPTKKFRQSPFRNTKKINYREVVGTISMTPDLGREMKSELQIAFVVQPKSPFKVVGKRQSHAATISSPIDVLEDFHILIGDLKCGLVLDKDSKVLASYEMR